MSTYLDDFTKYFSCAIKISVICVAKISWKYFSKIDCLPTADWWPYLWVWKWSYTLFKLHFPSIETCCWTSMASISLSHWGFLGVKMLEFLRPSLELQSCLVDESCSKQFYVAKLTNFPCFRIFLLFDRKTSALAAELSLRISKRWFVPFIVQGVKIRESDFLLIRK